MMSCDLGNSVSLKKNPSEQVVMQIMWCHVMWYPQGINIHDRVKKFYSQFYSSSYMTLAVMSRGMMGWGDSYIIIGKTYKEEIFTIFYLSAWMFYLILYTRLGIYYRNKLKLLPLMLIFPSTLVIVSCSQTTVFVQAIINLVCICEASLTDCFWYDHPCVSYVVQHIPDYYPKH